MAGSCRAERLGRQGARRCDGKPTSPAAATWGATRRVGGAWWAVGSARSAARYRAPVMSDADWQQLARAQGRAPICVACGVTALPGSAVGADADFVCDNADCEAFGERV